MSAPRDDARDLWLLSGCQALFMTTSILTVTIASVAARGLLARPELATLPQATVPLVAMFAAVPAAALMRRRGRRAGFLLGALAGVASGAICAVALWLGSYALFLVGVASLGLYQAFATYYRFAVADEAPERLRGRAVSFVLGGGVVAAVLGPTLASATAELVPTVPFLGAYLATIALNLAAVLAVRALRLGGDVPPAAATRVPLRTLLAAPRFALAASCCAAAQGVMMLIMTATPLAMLGHGHSLGVASLVVSAHVLAMFVPSFFSGTLIGAVGLRPVLAAGLVLMVVSALVAIGGSSGAHFAVALVVNGLAWNFLFVGGSTLLTGIADPDERAAVQGANEVLTFAATALATFASGAIYFSIGWRVLNGAGIVAIAAVAVLLVALGTRPFEAAASPR